MALALNTKSANNENVNILMCEESELATKALANSRSTNN